jgi:hypothetical protein
MLQEGKVVGKRSFFIRSFVPSAKEGRRCCLSTLRCFAGIVCIDRLAG